MTIKKQKIVAFATLILSVATTAASTTAHAKFPDHPIRLIVPFSPSGSTDLSARLIAEYASHQLGQTIVVENRAGAGGSLGMETVARAKADGYTLGMATMSTHGSNTVAYGDHLKYDPIKDFSPITNVATVPSVLAVNPNLKAKTIQEFIELAKAKPGTITYASPGVGSLGNVNMEHFATLSGIKLLHVPYKGSGQAMNDALGGQVDAITDNLPSALAHIKAGRLRALILLSDKRSPVLPDVPVYSEIGFPQMGTGGWFGIVAPAGTPPDVVQTLNSAVHVAMKNPDFVSKMKDAGATLIPNTPEQFQLQIQQAVERYRAVGKVAELGGK